MNGDVITGIKPEISEELLKKSIWIGIREAIRGTEADYTQVNLNKAILLLAIPMILELVMESTFALVDIYFVGKLGPSAVAAVGLTETYLFLLYSVGMGLATAVTAIIARRIGEKNREVAGRTAVQAVFLGLLISVPFAFAGILSSSLRKAGSNSYSCQLNHFLPQVNTDNTL